MRHRVLLAAIVFSLCLRGFGQMNRPPAQIPEPCAIQPAPNDVQRPDPAAVQHRVLQRIMFRAA